MTLISPRLCRPNREYMEAELAHTTADAMLRQVEVLVSISLAFPRPRNASDALAAFVLASQPLLPLPFSFVSVTSSLLGYCT